MSFPAAGWARAPHVKAAGRALKLLLFGKHAGLTYKDCSAGLYRNPAERVLAFLQSKHAGCFRVYNLCAEHTYAAARFGGRVVSIPCEDHQARLGPSRSCKRLRLCGWRQRPASQNSQAAGRPARARAAWRQAPPLESLRRFCAGACAFLAADARNVVAVHCKAGKGRTGVFICALLVHMVCSGLQSIAGPEPCTHMKVFLHILTHGSGPVLLAACLRKQLSINSGAAQATPSVLC